MLPGIFKHDPRVAARQWRERVGTGTHPLATGAHVLLDDRFRAFSRDYLDLDGLAAATHPRGDLGLGTDAAVGAGVLPVLEHVVCKRLVIRHHVEEVVDLLRGIWNVGGDSYRSHVPHGTPNLHGSPLVLG